MTDIFQNSKKTCPQKMTVTARAEMNHDELLARKLKDRTTGIAPTNKQLMKHV